jgi:gliding motility-associated-like protein
MNLAQGQSHSVSISPGDTSACIGTNIRFNAIFLKGSFRYIGTFGGKDYFMDTVARSWTEGRAAAQLNGMDLWVIDSLKENDAVYNMIPYRGRVDVMFWFGLYQDPILETAGTAADGWKWIDGRSLDTTFRYWLFNEPDNAFQTKFPANHAAMGLNVMNASWGDMTDTLPLGYNAYAIAETPAKPFEYLWSNGDKNPNTISVAPTVTTTYSFTVVYGGDTAQSNTVTYTVLKPVAAANFDFASGTEYCLEWNKIVFSNTSIVSNPSPVTYSWDFGDGTVSAQNAPTHRYGASQLYAVKLKATDNNGCTTTATKSVTILNSPLQPIISYPAGKNVFCDGDSVSLNTVVVQPDPGVVFKWYRGTDSVFTGRPYVAKVTGVYNLVAFNSNGCKDTSSVTVTVNSLPRKPSLSYTFGFTGIICAIDSTNFTAASPDPAFRYVWYKASSPFPTQLVQTTKNTNSVYGSSVVSSSPVTEYYMVRILDANSCFSLYSDSISVTTRPSPSSVITTNGKSSTFCEGDSVKLFGSSGSLGNTFSWTNNNVLIAGNDSTYTAKVAGVFRMTATNIYGCSRISNPIGVFVNRYPAVPTILPDPNIAELLVDGTISICNGSSTTLRINAVASATYQWYKDNSLISNARNTNVSVNLAGSYKIAVTVNNCTTNSLDQKVSVRPLPSGNLLTPESTIICDGSTIRVDANSSFRYQWYLNNVQIPGAVDAFILANTPGVYKTEFIDDKGCKRMSSNFVNLSLVKKPSPAFTYDLYCVNTISNFTNQSQSPNSGSVTYLWRFNNGSTSDEFNTTHIFPDSGMYRVSLTVIPIACPNLADSAVANIRVQSPAKGTRYEPINAEAGKPVGLVARAIGDLYQWRPTTGLNSPFIRIPILTPKTEQLYTVAITNRAGCITTDSILVRIFDEQDVFVAGAFTPNRDGKNDKIYPILVGVDVFNYLKIFNRWGTLVYQSNSIDPAQGWDGTYKGNDQPADTYTWVIDAVGQNGKPIRKSGSVVLIR